MTEMFECIGCGERREIEHPSHVFFQVWPPGADEGWHICYACARTALMMFIKIALEGAKK